MNETPQKKESPRWHRFKDIVSKIWYILFCVVVSLLIGVWGVFCGVSCPNPWEDGG